MYNRKAFKREAKQLMRESTPHFMLVALVYVLLTTGLNYVVTALTGTGSVLAGTVSVFLNILIALFSMVMSVGFANYTLLLSRKQQSGMGDLFDSFSFAGRSIGMNILVMIYTFLWTLLATAVFAILVAAAALLYDSLMVVSIIIMVVAYIALIVVVVAIVLRYAMAPFALAENPDAGAGEAIRRSVRMMRGHKGKLFVLELSFIGWALLQALIVLVVMGIGVFVSGTTWMFESLLTGEDWMGAYDTVFSLVSQMTIWTILAEVVCLPLTLWLTTYQQTTFARFFNFVSGYDYHVYMNGEGAPAPEQEAPAAPLSAPETPEQEPEPVPVPEQEPVQEEEKPTEPETPAANEYYNSIIPQEPAEDEEI